MTEEDVHLIAIQSRVQEMVAKVRDRDNELSDHERGELLLQLFAVMDTWERVAGRPWKQLWWDRRGRI
jgi:hypothetical protein